MFVAATLCSVCGSGYSAVGRYGAGAAKGRHQGSRRDYCIPMGVNVAHVLRHKVSLERDQLIENLLPKGADLFGRDGSEVYASAPHCWRQDPRRHLPRRSRNWSCRLPTRYECPELTAMAGGQYTRHPLAASAGVHRFPKTIRQTGVHSDGMKRLPLLLAVVGIACSSTTPYRKTWQPTTGHDVYPPLMTAAIALEPNEVETILAAGGVLIGYQATTRMYSTRSASVGGTHFIAVAGNETAHTSCRTAPLFGVNVTSCSTSMGYRPRKVAVFRLEVEGWLKLPPHLVPPTSSVAPHTQGYVSRDGCKVSDAWGTVKCSNDWKVHRWSTQ